MGLDKVTYDLLQNDPNKQNTQTKKKMSKTVANAALNLVAAPIGKPLELLKGVADQTVNTGLAIGRKAVNATTGTALVEQLKQELNVVLNATDADYVHEVKITGIVVGGKLYKLDAPTFTLNDTLGAAKKLAELINTDKEWSDYKCTATTDAVKEGEGEDEDQNADEPEPDDNILKDFLTKSNTLLVSIVKKQ